MRSNEQSEAQHAMLRHSSDTEPGISRKRIGRAWGYFDPDGKRITDQVLTTLKYILIFVGGLALEIVLENDEILVWDYTWATGVPTPTASITSSAMAADDSTRPGMSTGAAAGSSRHPGSSRRCCRWFSGWWWEVCGPKVTM